MSAPPLHVHIFLVFICFAPSLLTLTAPIIVNTDCYFTAVIATYEKSDQHTYLPMSILAVTFAMVTISVVFSYKLMSPQFKRTSLIRHGFYPVADQASIITWNEGTYVLALIILCIYIYILISFLFMI